MPIGAVNGEELARTAAEGGTRPFRHVWEGMQWQEIRCCATFCHPSLLLLSAPLFSSGKRSPNQLKTHSALDDFAGRDVYCGDSRSTPALDLYDRDLRAVDESRRH